MTLVTLTLRYVVLDVNFCYHEGSIWEQYRKERKLAPPSDGEVYLFVCRGNNQLLWLLGVEEFMGRHVVDSRRWRMPTGQTWDHKMLAEYALKVGIRLKGAKLFREALEDQKRERLRRRRLEAQ